MAPSHAGVELDDLGGDHDAAMTLLKRLSHMRCWYWFSSP